MAATTQTLDLSVLDVARRVAVIQRRAYRVEADLIGHYGIPGLHESPRDLAGLSLTWLGAFDGGTLVGVLGWRQAGNAVEIDRLAVDPSYARRGHGRALVEAVPAGKAVVSTGSGNRAAMALYRSLGFLPVATRGVGAGVTVTEFARSHETDGS